MTMKAYDDGDGAVPCVPLGECLSELLVIESCGKKKNHFFLRKEEEKPEIIQRTELHPLTDNSEADNPKNRCD